MARLGTSADLSSFLPLAMALCLLSLAMKKFSAIVVLALILGTMYGYVLGRLSSQPPHPPQSFLTMAPEYPTFLLHGNFWDQLVFWSGPPLFILFVWLIMTYVQQTYIQSVRARWNQETIEQVGELFKEVSSLASGRKDSSRGTAR